MATNVDGEKIQVVGVCGNEARIYDLTDGWGCRRFLELKTFSNHGQALHFAQTYEEKQKQRKRKQETKETIEVRRKSHKPMKEET